jgi:hypothetical protein
MKQMADTVLVSFEPSNGVGNCVLIVGRKTPGQTVDIINAFQGLEAEALYRKLITKKESKNS